VSTACRDFAAGQGSAQDFLGLSPPARVLTLRGSNQDLQMGPLGCKQLVPSRVQTRASLLNRPARLAATLLNW